MCRKLVEQFHVCSAGNFRYLPGKTTKVIWKMKTVHVALEIKFRFIRIDLFWPSKAGEQLDYVVLRRHSSFI